MPYTFLFTPEGVSVMTVALMGWMWRLRVACDEHSAPGSFRFALGTLGSPRRKAVRQSPSDRAEAWTGVSKNRHESVGAGFAPFAGPHDRRLSWKFAPTQPFATLTTPENGMTVFTTGRALSTAV